jgi:glutathionylspermidine synthase
MRMAPVHALVADPDQTTGYREFVHAAMTQGLLPDHLVRGEPYLALNAVVLDSADLQTLIWASECLATAFDQAARAIQRDVPMLIELGFPWVAAELLAADPPELPLIGRLDFVQDTSGRWWLLEFNADTPSGVREAIVADQLVWERLSKNRYTRPSERLAPALVRAFSEAVGDSAAERTLGLVTNASELEDLAQMAFTQRLLEEPLRDLVARVVLGDVDNLHSSSRGLRMAGSSVDLLYRYLPFEGILGTPAFAAIYDPVASGQLRLLNGLFGLLLQHKGLMTWIWEHRDDVLLAPEVRQAIHRHLPPTWAVDAYPREMARGDLVAKQVFGREGEEVFFGEDVDDELWQTLVRRRTYVAQQRIHVADLQAVVPTSLAPQCWTGKATVGCFVVRGHWAGFYTRFGGKIITSRAKWLATFIE